MKRKVQEGYATFKFYNNLNSIAWRANRLVVPLRFEIETMKIKSLFVICLLTLGMFTSCKVNHLAQIQPQRYQIAQDSLPNVAANAAIEALIQPYKVQMDAEMDEVIGVVSQTLVKSRPPMGTLGNWMSDLFYEQINEYLNTEIDFAMMNSGGIRIPTLQAGEITRGKIYELMPFDNMLVVVYLDAASVQQFADNMASYGGAPISKQLQFEIKDQKAQNVTVKGQPLMERKIYAVGTSDYIANGGDALFVGKERKEVGVLMRDAIIDYVKKKTAKGTTIEAKADDRIILLDPPSEH